MRMRGNVRNIRYSSFGVVDILSPVDSDIHTSLKKLD